MPNMVTLHCENGNHSWERVSQRGRRPHSCPEHTETREPTGRTREEATAEARATRASKAAEQLAWERDNLYPLVKGNDGGYAGDALSVLDFIDARIPEHQDRKVRGADAEDVDGDIKILNEQRDRILKRVKAQHGDSAETFRPLTLATEAA